MSVASAGPALAQPAAGAAAQHKAAAVQLGSGNPDKALELVEQGLAVAPRDRKLLALKEKVLFGKGKRLFEQRDYLGALDVYEAYLKLAKPGASRREAEKIVKTLGPVRTTSLEITVANGLADVYLQAKTLGVVCSAAPSCTKAWLPGQYDVIAERPGFAPWTGPVTLASGATTKLAITLVEEPSLLTVRVTPPGARVTVDGKVHDGATTVAAGSHQVVVSLAGHVETRLEAVAREGKPVELEAALTPFVPVRVEPPGAELQLDGKPAWIRDGALAIPPGVHMLVARAPGFQDLEIEIPAERGAGYKLAVELERAATGDDQAQFAPSRFTTQRKLALVVGGAGLAAVSAGVVLGVRAGQIEDGDDAQEADLVRRARTLESQLAYGAGGLAVAIAIGLWLDGAPGHMAPEPRVAVTPRAGAVTGLDLAVRF